MGNKQILGNIKFKNTGLSILFKNTENNIRRNSRAQSAKHRLISNFTFVTNKIKRLIDVHAWVTKPGHLEEATGDKP